LARQLSGRHGTDRTLYADIAALKEGAVQNLSLVQAAAMMVALAAKCQASCSRTSAVAQRAFRWRVVTDAVQYTGDAAARAAMYSMPSMAGRSSVVSQQMLVAAQMVTQQFSAAGLRCARKSQHSMVHAAMLGLHNSLSTQPGSQHVGLGSQPCQQRYSFGVMTPLSI
jgi:hypothetical protein